MNPGKFPLCLLMTLVMLAAGCNSDKPAENTSKQETAVTPVQDSSVADRPARAEEDSMTATSPDAEAPVTPLPVPIEEQSPRRQQGEQAKPRPRPQPEAVKEPAPTAGAFREGTYRLVQVQGESMPVVLDMTTECDTKLLRGVLSLKGGQFSFESYTAEECKGKSPREEKHEASGSYRLEGELLFLSIRYGDALGDARGVVEGNTIRLQKIGNDEEQQEVDWLLRLQ